MKTLEHSTRPGSYQTAHALRHVWAVTAAAIACCTLIGDSAPGQEITHIGSWMKVTVTDRFKDEKQTSYFLSATSIIAADSYGSLANTRTVGLRVACGPGVSVHLIPEQVLFNTTVRARFDRQPSWQSINPYDVNFASLPVKPSFLSDLTTASRLTIGVSSQINGSIVAEFDLKNGKEFMEDYQRTCSAK